MTNRRKIRNEFNRMLVVLSSYANDYQDDVRGPSYLNRKTNN